MAAVLSPPHLHPGLPRLPGFVRELRPVGRPVGRARGSLDRRRVAAPVAPVVPSAATYRRRQAVALVLVAALALMTQVALATVLGGVATSPVRAATAGAATVDATTSVQVAAGAMPVAADAAPSEAAAVAVAPAPSVYVVRSGDTLWSIAQRLQPGADPRPLVDALAERAGSSSLRPGQRIDLDGLAL